jgi:hypothetical protein
MKFFDLFKAPYLDGDDGANLGGGGTPTETAGQQTDTQPTGTTGQEVEQQTQTQEGQQTQQPQIPQKIKVKFNHEELEIPYEEAVTHIQKGMNYDKAVERARQEAAQKARDEWIAEQGYEWKGKRITTEAEYKEALREKQLEDEIAQKYAHLPEDVRKELAENRKFRERYEAKEKEYQRLEAERKAKEEYEARKTSMYTEFAEEFPDYANDPEKMKTIPQDVWADADKWLKSGGKEGRSLTDALVRYHRKQQMLEQANRQANGTNAAASTGSVRTDGKSQVFFTREQVEKMSMQEIMNNYDAIKESEKHWK